MELYLNLQVVKTEGRVLEFKTCGLWKERGYIPKSRRYYIFDWESDGTSDHVGIVEKCENEEVYIQYGNSNDDMCRQKEYDINNNVICGYGTPMY